MSTSETTKGNVKQVVFLIILALIVVLAAAGYIASKKTGPKKIIRNGDRAPEFRLSSLDGRQVGLSEFRGKVVMVHFWATWCPPCVEELPTLALLNKAMTGKDFVMLAVSVDEGGAGAVADFLRKNSVNVPVLLDPDHATASLYGTFKFPETYIVDKNGIVQQKIIGAVDWRNPSAMQMLNSLVESR